MTTAGPNAPGTAADAGTLPAGSTVGWTSPGNATTSNNVWASVGSLNSSISTYLQCTNYGFSIPAGATINGITVAVEDHFNGSGVNYYSVVLHKASGYVGSDLAAGQPTGFTTDAVETFGGATNLWGTTWSASDVNDAGFGVGVSYNANASGTRNIFVDYVTVTVDYTPATGLIFVNDGTSTTPDTYDGNFDNLTLVTGSWTPPSSGLIFCYASAWEYTGAPAPGALSMSGNGITWVPIASVTFTMQVGAERLTLFGANASGSTTGATTLTAASGTLVEFSTSFFHATGTDVANGVAQCFIQTVSATGTNTSSPATATLAAAGSSGNRPIAGTAMRSPLTQAPNTNWTEADEFITGYVGLETQYRGDAFDTSVATVWGAGTKDWVILAAEVKVAAATGQVIVVVVGL